MASSAATGTFPGNAFQIPWGGTSDLRSGSFPGHIGGFLGFRLIPSMFFGPGGLPGTRCEHADSALSSECGDFAILCSQPPLSRAVGLNPNAYPGAPGVHNPKTNG